MSHDICWCGPKEPAHSNAGSVAAQGKSLGHVPAEQPKDSAHRPTSAPLSDDELTAKARSMIREYEAAAMANRAIGSPVGHADLRATEQERVAAMLKALLAHIEHLQQRYVRTLKSPLGEAEAMCCCSDHNPNARPEKKHALAALCLDGQPFGFTWDDVEHVQLVAGQCDALRLGDNHAAVLRNLADRIAALLPPRE